MKTVTRPFADSSCSKPVSNEANVSETSNNTASSSRHPSKQPKDSQIRKIRNNPFHFIQRLCDRIMNNKRGSVRLHSGIVLLLNKNQFIKSPNWLKQKTRALSNLLSGNNQLKKLAQTLIAYTLSLTFFLFSWESISEFTSTLNTGLLTIPLNIAQCLLCYAFASTHTNLFLNACTIRQDNQFAATNKHRSYFDPSSKEPLVDKLNRAAKLTARDISIKENSKRLSSIMSARKESEWYAQLSLSCFLVLTCMLASQALGFVKIANGLARAGFYTLGIAITFICYRKANHVAMQSANLVYSAPSTSEQALTAEKNNSTHRQSSIKLLTTPDTSKTISTPQSFTQSIKQWVIDHARRLDQSLGLAWLMIHALFESVIPAIGLITMILKTTRQSSLALLCMPIFWASGILNLKSHYAAVFPWLDSDNNKNTPNDNTQKNRKTSSKVDNFLSNIRQKLQGLGRRLLYGSCAFGLGVEFHEHLRHTLFLSILGPALSQTLVLFLSIISAYAYAWTLDNASSQCLCKPGEQSKQNNKYSLYKTLTSALTDGLIVFLELNELIIKNSHFTGMISPVILQTTSALSVIAAFLVCGLFLNHTNPNGQDSINPKQGLIERMVRLVKKSFTLSQSSEKKLNANSRDQQTWIGKIRLWVNGLSLKFKNFRLKTHTKMLSSSQTAPHSATKQLTTIPKIPASKNKPSNHSNFFESKQFLNQCWLCDETSNQPKPRT